MKRTRKSKHYYIEQIKTEHNLKSSEQIFNIEEEIPLQCPRIDSFIEDSREMENHVDKINRLINNDTEINKPYTKREIEILLLYITTLRNQFEELRTACDNLRTRGHQWKILAKRLFDEIPNNGKHINPKYKNK